MNRFSTAFRYISKANVGIDTLPARPVKPSAMHPYTYRRRNAPGDQLPLSASFPVNHPATWSRPRFSTLSEIKRISSLPPDRFAVSSQSKRWWSYFKSYVAFVMPQVCTYYFRSWPSKKIALLLRNSDARPHKKAIWKDYEKLRSNKTESASVRFLSGLVCFVWKRSSVLSPVTGRDFVYSFLTLFFVKATQRTRWSRVFDAGMGIG